MSAESRRAQLLACRAAAETLLLQVDALIAAEEAELEEEEDATPTCPRCGATELADAGERDGKPLRVCPCGANVVEGEVVSG